MDFWQIIMTPFSLLLKVFCQWFNSYGIALILFTIIIKVILFPLSLKGKKSMIKMNIVSGQLKEIQKRCGNDRERYNQEVQKFYAENNVSPMGGCGWSLIPLIILMPLYAIIRRPLKYMMRLPDAGSAAVAGALGVPSFSPVGYNELTLAAQMTSSNLGAAKEAVTAAGLSAAGMFVVNFNFLGLNLAEIPTRKFWEGGVTWNSFGLFLMPIISAVLSFVSMIVSQKTNQMSTSQTNTAGSNKMMMIISPLISLWIGYSMPAGLCVYWIANSVLIMVQEVICGKMLKKDYEAARKELEEQQRKAKEEEKRRRREAAERKAAAIAAGKGKNKKTQPKAKDKGVDLSASRSGMRSYARGRAYDPDRYAVTPYRDPDAKYKKTDPDLEPLTDEEKELLAESGIEVPQEAPAEIAEAAESAEGTADETAEDFEEAYAPESEDETPKE